MIVKVILVNLALIIAGLGSLELWYWARTPTQGVAIYVSNAELGWAPAPNVSLATAARDANGPYPVVFKTYEHGFREWGDINATRPKVLFVGDSFTGDAFTSNADAYFGIVKERLAVEVFAAGASGYGTLQEMLLIRKPVSLIKPDVIVLQFCTNDFWDNSWEGEESFIFRTQKNFRPYLVDGSLRYRPAELYRFLTKWSYFFRAADAKLQRFQFSMYGGYYSKGYETRIKEQMDAVEATTLELLKRFVEIAPKSTRFATFICQSKMPEVEARWIRAAKTAGFVVWPEVARAVDAEFRKGEIVTVSDGGHWNRRGNHVVGTALVQLIGELLKESTAEAK